MKKIGYAPLKNVFFLSLTEACERYAFYGARSFLILYMLDYLKFNENQAYSTYAAIMSLLYITPVFGGIIADTVIGIRTSIILGCLFNILGYICLAFYQEGIYLGYSLIAVGLGFFKPSITNAIGNLYKGREDDSSREAGFALFYFLLNAGAFLGPLGCGLIGQWYGWSYIFLFSALIMLIGLFTFLIYSSQQWIYLAEQECELKDISIIRKKAYSFFFYTGIFLSVLFFIFLLKNNRFFDYLFLCIVFIVIGKISLNIKNMNIVEKKKYLPSQC